MLDFGTPNLQPKSPAEAVQLESFFVELRYGDPALAFSKYVSLTQRRSEDFWNAVGKVLTNRKVPNNTESGLPYCLVFGWLHSFYWGLSNEDRLLLLHRVYRASPKISQRTIRRAIKSLKSLGLKDWSDFRQTYLKPPFWVTLFREGQQEMVQFHCNWPGHI